MLDKVANDEFTQAVFKAFKVPGSNALAVFEAGSMQRAYITSWKDGAERNSWPIRIDTLRSRISFPNQTYIDVRVVFNEGSLDMLRGIRYDVIGITSAGTFPRAIRTKLLGHFKDSVPDDRARLLWIEQ